MNDPAIFLALFILGISAGMVYFGGLWLTVLFAAVRRHYFVFAVSFILRAAFAGAAFLTAAVAGWQQGVVMGIGFFLARWVILGKYGPQRPEEEMP